MNAHIKSVFKPHHEDGVVVVSTKLAGFHFQRWRVCFVFFLVCFFTSMRRLAKDMKSFPQVMF